VAPRIQRIAVGEGMTIVMVAILAQKLGPNGFEQSFRLLPLSLRAVRGAQ
jgi:hypothetical protein